MITLSRIDPFALAQGQLARDVQRMSRFHHLLERKMERIAVSPLAFLRGSAPLFYELLVSEPDLAAGPEGEGWLVGDIHVENFGAYRPDLLTHEAAPVAASDADHAKKRHDAATFNLNDFDEAVIGPWRLDVLRLVTSVLLSRSALAIDGKHIVSLATRLLDGYVASAFFRAPLPPEPRCVAALVTRAAERCRKDLLDDRTAIDKNGRRHFLRGDRYRELPPAILEEVPAAFGAYARKLADDERPDAHQLEVLDAAARIAGTGSLGTLRIAVLVRGKGGENGAWVFDMKAQQEPAASVLLGKTDMLPGERVALALRACLENPPKMVGTTQLGEHSMLVRRLAPQEDKLNWATLRADDLEPLVYYLGALLGAAHVRGATKKPATPWSETDKDAILERAIALAGLHEAVYLATCKLSH